MALDVNKIIMESLADVSITESAQEVGKNIDKAIQNVKDSGQDVKDEATIKATKAALTQEDLPGALGRKSLKVVKDTGEDIKDAIKDHPGMTGAAAAAIAAGLGALALRKRMKKIS